MTTATAANPIADLVAAARAARTHLRAEERRIEREIEAIQDQEEDLTAAQDRDIERLESQLGQIEEVLGAVADTIRESRRLR